MWRDRDPYRDHQYVPDTFWLLVAALLFATCGLVWLIGQVAAILFGAHEHLPVRLVDMLGVLLRLPGTWDDSAQAWPSSSQPLLPGPVGMYAAAVLTFWLPPCFMGYWSGWSLRGPVAVGANGAAKWASWWQLRRLLVLGPRRGRIILGHRNRQLWESTRNLYNLVAAGALDHHEVDHALLQAAERCGLLNEEPRLTHRTLASGRQVGLAHPGRPRQPTSPERTHPSPPLRAAGERIKEGR